MANILAPSFLVNHIALIGYIMGVMVLVIFDEFVSGKIIFPVTDFIKAKFFEQAMSVEKVKKHRKLVKYASEFIATIIFIFYCYVGYLILAEYIIIPILTRLQNALLLVIIIVFLLISYVYNSRKLRRKYLIG